METFLDKNAVNTDKFKQRYVEPLGYKIMLWFKSKKMLHYLDDNFDDSFCVSDKKPNDEAANSGFAMTSVIAEWLTGATEISFAALTFLSDYFLENTGFKTSPVIRALFANSRDLVEKFEKTLSDSNFIHIHDLNGNRATNDLNNKLTLAPSAGDKDN